MKSYLLNRKGSILLYVLAFYLFFLSWFHVMLISYTDYLRDLENSSIVKRHLEFEKKAIKHLEAAYPLNPDPFIFEGKRADFLCLENNCEISITGDIKYHFKYVIIEESIIGGT